MVPIANGSDGGGSIRIPASICGLVGLKPSRGLVPFTPALVELAYTIGTNHALTRTVRDCAALLDISSGAVQGAPFAEPRRPETSYLAEINKPSRRLHIALFTETVSGLKAHPDCAAAAERTAKLCQELGHEVVEAKPSYDPDQASFAFNTIAAVNVATAIDKRLTSLKRELRDDDVEPLVRMMYEGAKEISALDVVKALQSAEQLGYKIGEFFADYDVALSPTMLGVTPPIGLLDTSNLEAMIEHGPKMSAFTKDYNLAGTPAISLPLGHDSDGMPVGVQFAACHGGDAILLRLAADIERAAPWPTTPVWAWDL
jgi:amidase